ncbi:MAG: hypothetical protein ACO3C1_11620 [Ilumatobacteraceae bacterium]
MTEDISINIERLTIKSTPPNARKPQRRSYWPTVFAEARECPGEWVRTEKWFNRSTAAQVASDLRNAHRRATKMRVSGFMPGDRWDTRWDNDPADDNPDHFYIWLRFDGLTAADRRRMLEEAAW